MARLVVCLGMWAMSATAFAQGRGVFELEAVGKPRKLPERILGASAEPFWDNNPTTDPAKVAAIKTLRLAFVRFPGGSQSNFYDWKRGLFFAESGKNDSEYYALFVGLSQFVTRKFPDGIFLEQYQAFSDKVGAEVILVPNLETASVDDQVAWFKHLAKKQAVPRYIELGNEFWGAMGDDPVSRRRWPDEPTSRKTVHRYLQAIKPYFPPGTKVAWQAAAPSYRGEPSNRNKVVDGLRQWNEDLQAEPWFDAVTIHLYPRLNQVLDGGAARDALTPEIARRNVRALLARVDDGMDTVIQEAAQHVPGKEIWVTEWNPAGSESSGKADRVETTTGPMETHLVTRGTLAQLRQPQITVSLFFALRFKGDSYKCPFVMTDRGYQPTEIATILRWLNDAANGGATYQRYVAAGNPRVPGGGKRKETFGEVEAGFFRHKNRSIMILQNASDEARVWKINDGFQLGLPAQIEQLAGRELIDAEIRVADVQAVRPAKRVRLSPWSITRIVWK